MSRGSETVNITEDVRKYAQEQGIAEDKALEQGMKEKSDEFKRSGAVLYQKA